MIIQTTGGESATTTTSIGTLPSGALTAVSPQIIFDGKIINADDSTSLWQNTGTGTFTFTGNKLNMSVTAGQYCIRQSRRVMPYFSGYPIIVEETFDNFGITANLVKRVGYFSSNAVAPYDTAYDGFALEMDGTTYRLRAWNNGTSTVNVPFASWDNYGFLQNYNWSNFTAIYFDFLWLGGAALRIWVCTPDRGWVLGHSAQYIGNNQSTICLTPNQPLRYEIRSTTGVGSFRYICSQMSVGGNVSSLGNVLPCEYTTGIACNAVGTTYALQGFKKRTGYRDIPIKFSEIFASNGATSDTGLLYLLRNPTLSASLTYANYDKIDRAVATTQTVSAKNEIIGVAPIGTTGQGLVPDNYKAWMTQAIDNTFDEYVLAYMPLSTNQTINGVAILKTF